MNITVVGCGRWGSFIGWYLDRIGHNVSFYGPKDSDHMRRYLETRTNGLIILPPSIGLITDINKALASETIIISIPSQSLRSFLHEVLDTGINIKEKTFILCMKGIEIESGKRLSEVFEEVVGTDPGLAVWLGPGHPQDFVRQIPNCMVIDSKSEDLKKHLVDEFKGPLIRFYYGSDLIGNEIGAAAKNVIGIAAGVLDGIGKTCLKGPLMSRGTSEIARLISACGGNELSAYGLCHLGDYEATVFSKFSHNRAFGEMYAKGETFPDLAEGYYTAKAIKRLADQKGVELPICNAVYAMLYEGASIDDQIANLFVRSIKQEF